LPENIPDFGDEAVSKEGQLNILVAGKNGSLVDTMIYANINPATREITLVSIPRDLYYNNRKINSYYALYGMNEMKRILSNVTGYKIDKVVLIDMYAFVEVVDILGGIDVHLEEAVIDPTYKTFDGGKWGTLYYRAGDHHLSGKQALRLARTRHTSSDFARAERQQMILKALQEKAQKGGFGNAENLSRLVGVVLTKVETDITAPEVLNYYFKYQSFKVRGGNVLSSGNVLASKMTGEQKQKDCLAKIDETAEETLKEEEKKKCQAIDKGEYILEPKNGNWNSVKWYFNQIMIGEV
jgi:LCP family protein required for cell wall assembly